MVSGIALCVFIYSELSWARRKEADDAVEITRTTSGVQRVVKLFEYLD